MGRHLSFRPSPANEPVSGVLTEPRPVREKLVVSCLGGFSLEVDGHPLPVVSRKAQALLAFLALDGPANVSRERLCGLLWSEVSEIKARASLRQIVHALKATLGAAGSDVVEAGRQAVSLSGSWATDVAQVVGRLGRGEIDARLLGRKRLADTLLPGFEDADPAFRVWLLVQRQVLQEELARGLERVLAGGDPARSRDAAAALLNLDPTHEEACRSIMRDTAARGDVAAALKIYKRLWDMLDEEYGTEPSDLTQALVVQIKNNEIPAQAASEVVVAAPAVTPRPVSLDDHPYLLVAPFDIRGVGVDYSHLVGGLRHELIAKLIRFREWSVIDGTPTADDATLPGRRFSIEATLRQAGSSLSLTITVKEQPVGLYLWSESFAIEPERWFEIEPSLLRRIAMAVNVHLTDERSSRTIRRPDVPVGIYERWLLGQKTLHNFKADDDARAVAIFKSIVDDAPDFSSAWSSLAQSSNSRHLAFPGLLRTQEDDADGLSYATKAVRLDPFDSRAHLSHGWALATARLWDRAESSVDLALKLNENDPWTLTSAALLVAFCGNHDAAVELAEQALLLRPQPPPVQWAYQATIRFVCRDYAGVVEAAERAEEAISNIPGWHAAALAHLGDGTRAREKADTFLRLMRKRWHGPALTDEAVISWFVGAFPFRVEADRLRLNDGLAQALSH